MERDRLGLRMVPTVRATGLAWWAILLPAVLIVGGVALLGVFAHQLEVTGTVVDAETGEPVAGARIVISDYLQATTDNRGTFRLVGVRLADRLVVEADGYRPSETRVLLGGGLTLALEPIAVEVTVSDAGTGTPVMGVALESSSRVTPVEPARFRLTPAHSGSTVTIRASGYRQKEVTIDGDRAVQVELEPVLTGTVLDARTRLGIPGAVVQVGQDIVATGLDGAFTADDRQHASRVWVMAPGYRRAAFPVVRGRPMEMLMQPFEARALYLSFGGVSDRGLLSHALELIEKTELNAVVIDVKGDRGYLAYHSEVPLAEAIGANELNTIPDIKEFMAYLKTRDIYTIARIVAFKDDRLARNGPRSGLDVAVRDSKSGQVWIDGEGLGWVDPFRPEVWDYNIALAVEAARKGFEEVQFDYIRFPTDPGSHTSLGAARFSREATDENGAAALAEFLKRARQALHAEGAYLAVDVFGYITMVDEMGIGQHLESLAEHVDYLSPMLYPSTYGAGLPGGIPYPEVVDRPYDVVFQSLARARERLAGASVAIRPWLQYFDDYSWATGLRYEARHILAQKKAAQDAGATGWMVWDPFNRYDRGGFEPER